MKQITEITKEQQARMPEWRDKWIKIGLSVEPADFDKAEAAVKRAYTLCGLEQPKAILRMSSPIEATRAGPMALCAMEAFKKNTKGSGKTKDYDRALDDTWDKTLGQLGVALSANVAMNILADIKPKIKEGLYNYRGGQLFHAGWCAYVSFFRDVMGWDDEDSLMRFSIEEDICTSCGWVWWHEDVAVISDRPSVVNLDNEGRLHCENGPSIAYRDGWSMYHWHGVAVPENWILDKASLTASEAINWPNVEQRRSACEIIGWTKVLEELDSHVIDEDPNPQIGTLLECDLPGSGKEKFLQVKCGTGRLFVIPVPKEMKTALEANLWTFNYKSDPKFLPEVRT